MAVLTTILEELFLEFTEFLQAVSGEDFISFKTSAYIDEQENYKYYLVCDLF